MTIVGAIRDALMEPHAGTSEERVHGILANRLAALAPDSSLKSTSYFNHSWAPDFVLTSGNQIERGVYLRFGVHDATFVDDLEHLSDSGPMFLDLEAANPSRPEQQGEDPGTLETGDPFRLDAAVAQVVDRGVLVTEVSAIDEFETKVAQNRGIRNVTQQIVSGGQGLIDEPTAANLSASWGRATSAIAQADSVSLRQALDAVEAYLSRIAGLDYETVLRSDWIAAGLPAEAFPGREDWLLSDRAPWEIAGLVLSLSDAESVPTDRWREIAEAVDLSSLGHELYGIGEYREGGSVNELVRAAMPLWTAQFAYVPPLPSDTVERFDWSFGDYSIALNLISHRAYFTDIGKKWSRVPRANVLPSARARLPILERADVTGVGLVTPEENATYELRPTASMSLGTRLKQHLADDGDAAWREARITSLDMRVPGTNASANIDFSRSVVKTTYPVPIRTYALLCARFVAGLREDEVSDLAATFGGD